MPLFDLPLDELRRHRTAASEPDGLDAFWERALRRAREAARDPVREPYRPETYGALSVEDVTFSGADGDPVRAWFIAPRDGDARLACLVTFIGYGGGRGLPVEHTLYPSAGLATLVMDTRGQGGWWTVGATGDPGAGQSGPEYPGMMTRGVHDPETYYYRRLYVDAVRAVETAAAHPRVDPERIAVGGRSQGGGLALAAAALAPERVRICHADVPFLCDIERGVDLSPRLPYNELAAFLAVHPERIDAVRRTLRHVDCALLASRIRAHSLLSVGLMDEICPPSTVFAAYNAMDAPKDIAVFPYSGHETPPGHFERQLAELVAELR